MSHSVPEHDANRFWALVNKPNETGCRLWKISKCQKYGQFNMGGRKNRQRDSSHRVAWRLANNQDIPEGFYVCHSCDIPKCCEPTHLFLGTPEDNSKDMVSKKRSVSGSTSKLTRSDIIFIQNCLLDGVAPSVLAEIFNISEGRVSQIKHNKHIKSLKEN